MGNDIGFVPLGLEMNCFFVPINDCGWDLVHGINYFHEGDWDSPRKEVNECIIICDFTKSGVAFELGDLGCGKPCNGCYNSHDTWTLFSSFTHLLHFVLTLTPL